MTPLQLAMIFTLQAEGGYTDDSGGPTMNGVTQTTYDGFRSSHGLVKQSVKLITPVECDTIMEDMYWTPAHCDLLDPKTAIAHFDTSFNQGVDGAIKILQRALGVTADGDIGNETIAAINACDPVALILMNGSQLIGRLQNTTQKRKNILMAG